MLRSIAPMAVRFSSEPWIFPNDAPEHRTRFSTRPSPGDVGEFLPADDEGLLCGSSRFSLTVLSRPSAHLSDQQPALPLACNQAHSAAVIPVPDSQTVIVAAFQPNVRKFARESEQGLMNPSVLGVNKLLP